MRISIVLFLLTFLTLSAFSKPLEKRNTIIHRVVGTPPVVDGQLTDSAWTRVSWISSFTQFRPTEGKSPTQKTAFKLLYDNEFIYVMIWAKDSSPDSISYRLSRRDQGDGDAVGVEFDSYNDHRTSFSFWVNAAGTKVDYTVSNDGNEDETWDPIWYVKTSHDSTGWYAEAKIPLTELRFKADDGQVWGLQVGRIIFRNQETSLWQPASREQSGWVSQYGILNWDGKVSPHRTASFTPFFVAKTDRYATDGEDPFLKLGHKETAKAGFDARLGLTNNLILDMTVNPDFGQVEADPSQLNLSAFETYRKEQRPFFIEGKNIFNFPLVFGDGDLGNESLFYSRRIGRSPQNDPELADGEYVDKPNFTNIIGAAKITGKSSNGLSVGILESVTDRTNATIDLNGSRRQVEVEPLTNYAVGRVEKDLNGGNTQIGGMVTSTIRNIDSPQINSLHRSAHAAGINFNHSWKDKKWYFSFNSYMSHVEGDSSAIVSTQESSAHYFQRPDAANVRLDSSRRQLTGSGGKLEFGKSSGKFLFMLASAWKSPQLELNDLGFMRQANSILEVFWMGYRINEPFSIFRNVGLNFNQWNNWDYGGTFLSYGGNINVHATFKNLWSAGFGSNFNSDEHSLSLLRGGPTFITPANLNYWLFIESNEQKKLVFSANYYRQWGINSNFILEWGLNTSITYKPFSRASISINPEYDESYNQLQYYDTYTLETVSRYLLATIHQKLFSLSFRLNVSITPDLSIQYWGQPFVAAVKYDQYKVATNTNSTNYSERFHLLTNQQLGFNSADNTYAIDENVDGTVEYPMDNPDFNTKEFLSNLVIRWEYIPGSTIYLVWSQSRDSYAETGRFNFRPNMKDLFNDHPRNIFLIKFSYRFSR
jgi:Domain of unknown function (DUF1083).